MSDAQRFWERVHEVYPTRTMQMTFTDDPATAEDESARDAAELVALVPPLPEGAHIVELAAGFGRLTLPLAGHGHVVAYDFVEHFCAENQARHLGNVEIRNEDAITAELPQGVDLVFWSWLLQLLSDEDAEAVLAKARAALRPGGVLVFRESCAPETMFWEGPPRTLYRAPSWYSDRLPGAELIAMRTWDEQWVFRVAASSSA